MIYIYKSTKILCISNENLEGRYMTNFFESQRIKRLEFVLTNQCNLACKYCYAKSGSYFQRKSIISMESIHRTYELIQQSNIKTIDEVVFFGGEPLLAIREIEQICKLFSNFGDKSPIFKMVTNLTIVSDLTVKVLKKYKILLTVSLDGPKHLNDSRRIFRNSNKSVYNTVAQNINLFADLNIPITSIESTYNKNIQNSYTRSELANYFLIILEILMLFKYVMSTQTLKIYLIQTSCSLETLTSTKIRFLRL